MERGTANEVRRIQTDADLAEALSVLDEVYRREQGWVADAGKLLSVEALSPGRGAWYVAVRDGRGVGVVRLLFDLPLDRWREYPLAGLVEWSQLEALVAAGRIAELGRFAVRPAFRRHSGVAVSLLREALTEVVRRGGTHLLTDVFEGGAHNPLRFLLKVAGFAPVARHQSGELSCSHPRVALIMDLVAAYGRVRKDNPALFRMFTRMWTAELHASMLESARETE